MRFNLIFIIFIFLLYGCGYQPLYKLDEREFSIISFETNGSDIVAKNLIKNFERLKDNKEAKQYYEVIASSKITTSINSKDSKGGVETFLLKISVNIIVKEDNQIIQKKKFLEKNIYSNLNNKFELKKYENILIKGQTTKIINKINTFLRSL